jgi:calcium-dependent protein kinase
MKGQTKSVINKLQKYKGGSNLKKAVMNMVAKMLDDKEVEDLKVLFQSIDSDGSGFISCAELFETTQNFKLELSRKDVDELVKQIDYAGNNKIKYSEFLSATADISTFLNDSRLRAIFQIFDTDNSGVIT